jgi:Big-like domain-containing protein/fibronectin type III domain protein
MPHIFKNNWKGGLGLFAFALAIATTQPASAANLRLAWNSSSDPSVTGYNLAYGSSSGHYSNSINAGNSTSATVGSLTPGATYYFVVTAYNSIGLQSLPSNEVSLVVPNNIPPTVSLTTPVSGDKFHPGSPISMTATASDSDGTIVKVEFYQDANKVGQSTSAPYAATWSNPPSGTFNMTALAYDDAGAAVRSAGASIQIMGNSTGSPTPSPTPGKKIKAVAMTPIITAGDTAKFKVVASDVDPAQSTIVKYSMGGTATAGVNYSTAGVTGQVTIPAGKLGAFVSVTTLPTKGANRTALLTVLPGNNYQPGRASTAAVKILGR